MGRITMNLARFSFGVSCMANGAIKGWGYKTEDPRVIVPVVLFCTGLIILSTIQTKK